RGGQAAREPGRRQAMTVPQRDHELSRIYSEGAWPEPRRQIDEAILEASRRSARARHPVLHRWGPPLGLAATVVLGVSLALLVTDNQSLREASRLSDEAPRPAPQKKREAAAPASRADTARGEAEAKPGAPPAPHELFSSPMGPTEVKPAPAAKAAPPAAHPTPPASQPVPPAARRAHPARDRAAPGEPRGPRRGAAGERARAGSIAVLGERERRARARRAGGRAHARGVARRHPQAQDRGPERRRRA